MAAAAGEGSAGPGALYGNTVAGLRALAGECDLIVRDDGFFSGPAGVDALPARVLSTPDLLDALVSLGRITPGRRLECRDRLRGAGRPVSPGEGGSSS